MVSQPLISLCMIVKNEESNLPLMLESVRGAVDEIVVVDTGSTDVSISIAQQYGATIISTEWNHNFAQARNVGLNYAQGKWILFLDADEELEREDINELRLCAAHEEFDGFFIQIHNHLRRGSASVTINPILRMFRNRREYRFEGIIHEQIAASITRHLPNAKFHVSNVRIHHFGYAPETIIEKKKLDRNMTLLRKALKTNSNDSFYLYNIGIEHLRAGDVNSAFDAFHLARLNADSGTSYTHLLYKFEARTLALLGRLIEAVQICQEGVSLYPDYTDLHHYMAVYLIRLGYLEKAKVALQHAISIGRAPAHYHTEEGLGTYQSWYILADLFEVSRDYEVAINFYAEVIRHNRTIDAPLYRIFQILRVIHKESEIDCLLREKFILRTSEAIVKVANILLTCGCYPMVRHLIETLPEPSYTIYKQDLLLRLSLLSGNLSAVSDDRLSTLYDTPFHCSPKVHCSIHQSVGWICWLQNDFEGIKQTLMNLMHLGEKNLPLLNKLWTKNRFNLTAVLTRTEQTYHEELFKILLFAIQVAHKHGRIDKATQWVRAWRNSCLSLSLPQVDFHETSQRFVQAMTVLANNQLESLCLLNKESQLLYDLRLSLQQIHAR